MTIFQVPDADLYAHVALPQPIDGAGPTYEHGRIEPYDRDAEAAAYAALPGMWAGES